MTQKAATPAASDTPQDQTPAATPAPAVSVLKAPELIAKATTGVPGLATEGDALKLIFGAYAQFVVPKKDKTAARTQLGAFFNAQPKDVQKAIMKLHAIVSASSEAIAESAQQSMEIDIDPRTLDIAKRGKAEVDEQNALDEKADSALANVQAIVTALGLTDRYAEELKAKDLKPRKSPKEALVKKLVESGILAVDRPAVDMQPEEPGWETPPVFDVNDDNVARLLAKIDGVLTMLSENAGPTQREQVEAQLANFSVTRDDLEDTVYQVSKLAHEQLDQSAKILDRVRKDQKFLAEQIEAINFVKGVYQAVLSYFFPDASLKDS